jgi:DNA-binding SARP family transcriptional activator/TolB-like protein
MFRLRTLGGLALERDGAPIESASAQRKALALLAVLARSDRAAVGGASGLDRERLMALFWPESDEERARGALRQTLHVLRRELLSPNAITGATVLRIDPGVVEVDVQRFQAALAAGDLREAVARYAGPFLDGVHIDGAQDFEHWAEVERAALARDFGGALWGLAQSAEDSGDHDVAAEWWRRAQNHDPLDGRVVIRLMEALGRIGDRAAALRHAAAHDALLRQELGASPDPNVSALGARLRAGEPASAAHARPSQVSTEPVAATQGRDAGVPSPNDVAHSAAAPAGHPRGARRAKLTLLIGAVAVVVGAVAVVEGRAGNRPSNPLALDADRIAVTVFDNRTGDPALDPVGQMAADWVTRGIARMNVGHVLDPATFYAEHRGARGPRDARELARQYHAALVVAGSYYRGGDSLYFAVRVLDTATGQLVRVLEPVGAPLGDPVGAIEEVRQRVASAIGSVLDPRAKNYTDVRTPPPTLPAYREFVAGMDAYWRGETQVALGHFEAAARSDTTFETAAMWVGVNAVTVGRCALADSIDRALAARHNGVPPDDEFGFLATSRARCDNDFELGMRLARARLAADPGSAFDRWRLATNAWHAGHVAEAIAAFRSIDPATQLGWISDSGKVIYWRELAAAYHALGKYDAELGVGTQLGRRVPDRLSRIFLTARALVGAGRPAEALRALDGAEQLPPDPALVASEMALRYRPVALATPAWVMYQIATELAAHGFPDAARDAAERAARWSQTRPTEEQARPEHRLTLARTLEFLGRYDEAARLATGLVRQDSENADLRGTAGVIAARAGIRADALGADAWLAQIPLRNARGLPTLYRARIAALLGDERRAEGLLEGLPHRVHPTDPLQFHTDPAFAALRGRPWFAALARPRP